MAVNEEHGPVMDLSAIEAMELDAYGQGRAKKPHVWGVVLKQCADAGCTGWCWGVFCNGKCVEDGWKESIAEAYQLAWAHLSWAQDKAGGRVAPEGGG